MKRFPIHHFALDLVDHSWQPKALLFTDVRLISSGTETPSKRRLNIDDILGVHRCSGWIGNIARERSGQHDRASRGLGIIILMEGVLAGTRPSAVRCGRRPHHFFRCCFSPPSSSGACFDFINFHGGDAGVGLHRNPRLHLEDKFLPYFLRVRHVSSPAC